MVDGAGQVQPQSDDPADLLGDPPSPGDAALWGTLGVPEFRVAENPTQRRCDIRNVIQTPFARLVHAVYAEGATVPRHVHDRPSIVYGAGGPCVEQASGGVASKGRMTFHPAGFAHALRYGGPTHVLAIEFESHWWAGRAHFPAVSVALPATVYEEVWQAILLLAAPAASADPDAAAARLARTLEVVEKAHVSALVRAALERLHERWREPAEAGEIAAALGCSPAHLCREFKSALGVTMTRYVMLLRLDRARALLWGADMPIADVAAETGFSDQSHLTRLLLDATGRTPLRFRWIAPCLRSAERREASAASPTVGPGRGSG